MHTHFSSMHVFKSYILGFSPMHNSNLPPFRHSARGSSATGQCFRRNSNFIKPRQSEQKPVSTELQPTTVLPGIPQDPPALQQPAVPSSQATSTVDAIPTVPPSMQNRNSTPRTPRQPRVSRRSTKGIPAQRLMLQK